MSAITAAELDARVYGVGMTPGAPTTEQAVAEALTMIRRAEANLGHLRTPGEAAPVQANLALAWLAYAALVQPPSILAADFEEPSTLELAPA